MARVLPFQSRRTLPNFSFKRFVAIRAAHPPYHCHSVPFGTFDLTQTWSICLIQVCARAECVPLTNIWSHQHLGYIDELSGISRNIHQTIAQIINSENAKSFNFHVRHLLVKFWVFEFPKFSVICKCRKNSHKVAFLLSRNEQSHVIYVINKCSLYFDISNYKRKWETEKKTGLFTKKVSVAYGKSNDEIRWDE